MSITRRLNSWNNKADYQSLAVTILKIGCLAVGLALMVILYKGSPLGSWILMNKGWDNSSILLLEKLLIPIIGVGLYFFIRTPNFLRASLFAGLILAYALLEWVNGGKPMLFWGVLAHLSKIILPFLLYLLWSEKMAWLSGRLFQVAIALIFISHGVAAVLHHPVYIDYLISFGHRISGLYISETKAEYILSFIGVVDIVGGLAVLFIKHRYLLGWLMFWGFITALWRVIDTNLWNIGSLLIRSPHYLLPLAYFLWLNKEPVEVPCSDASDKVL